MTLVQLRYFKAVCKYNNITKAATELDITQPSISNAIKDLEEEMGIKLFHRLSKGLSLTEEGRYFLEKSGEILDKAEQLTDYMKQLSARQKELKVGVPPMAGTFLFPFMFQRFRIQHPNINLTIIEHGSIHIRDLVANGALDAAIIASTVGEPVDNNYFDSISILEVETLFCVSEQHQLAVRKEVDIHTIKDEPLVLFKEDSFQTSILKKLFARESVTPNIILHSSQLHTIKELVSNNIACSVLFHGVIGKNEGIAGIPFRNPMRSTIYLIWNKNKSLHSDIAKFIDFTRGYRHNAVTEQK